MVVFHNGCLYYQKKSQINVYNLIFLNTSFTEWHPIKLKTTVLVLGGHFFVCFFAVELTAKAVIFSYSWACCDTDKWMTQVTIPRSKKNNVQDLRLTNISFFSSKSLSQRWKMNLSASCLLQMKAIRDQLINGTIFHSCESVITKGIET